MDGATTRTRVKAFLDSAGLLRLIKVIAVVGFLMATYTAIQQARYSRCLGSYNNRASAVSQQRSEALRSTTDAVDKFIQAIAHSGTLPASQRADAIRAAFETYLKTRAAADEQRKLNPLPDPPSETC